MAIVIVTGWALIACLLAGLAAVVFRYPSLWGNNAILLEYALPVPFGWGMLHLPGLAIFGGGLLLAYWRPTQWAAPLRSFCFGMLIAVAAVAILAEPVRGFPLLLYVVVDAVTALVVSLPLLLSTARAPGATSLPRWIHPTLMAAPAALVVIAVLLTPLLLPRYNFVRSDTRDISSSQDVVQFWVSLRRTPGAAIAECRHLKKYADKRRTAYPRRNGSRHRAILLFRNRDDMRGAGAVPWVTYEWWPDGRSKCSAEP